MQKFKFPMEYLRVTQGENGTASHKGSLAMDFGGRDGGCDRLFAPCDMVVKRCRSGANGEMYLESTDKVLFADGTSDYARLLCIHDAVFNKKAGDTVKQGEYFYDEGGMGSGKADRFAAHVHIEAGKGRWKSTTQSKNAAGTYVCERQESLYKLFILGSDVAILADGGYKWVQENGCTKAIEAQLKTAQAQLAAEADAKAALQDKLTAAQKKLAVANKNLAAEKERTDVLTKENAGYRTVLDKIKKLTGG